MSALTPPAGSIALTLYRKSNGQIVGRLRHSGGASGATAIYGEIAGTFDAATHYIDLSGPEPAAAVRPALPITLDTSVIKANGADKATFAGIPAATDLALDGEAMVTVSDGTVAFNAIMAGSYSFLFRKFPFLDARFTVVAG